MIELPNTELWIQIKSRETGIFSDGEKTRFFAKIQDGAAKAGTDVEKHFALILESSTDKRSDQSFESLLTNCNEIACLNPEGELISLIADELGAPEIIAEGVASDLYKLVAAVAAENASVTYAYHRRISTTEIERRIIERLEAEDPSLIDEALRRGVLEPSDLVQPQQEPSFYEGVKVGPGHVAAGLVIERHADSEKVVQGLKRNPSSLISGPSGAGKSALLWLSVYQTVNAWRWFRIRPNSKSSDSASVVRFIQSRRPTSRSPIAIAFDEVDSASASLWNALSKEFRQIANVYLLGSIRNEDLNLVSSHADLGIYRIRLTEKLAESIWRKLQSRGKSSWGHWREPFELSKGLILEYTHLLTQGRRLSAVIGDQISIREQEGRTEELSIIRCCAEICSRGGEIEIKRLASLLTISPDRAAVVLRRLLDEHIVRENRPGVVGGLHQLRSLALREASHDGVVYIREESFWMGLKATSNESLSKPVRSFLSEIEDERLQNALIPLANTLALTSDVKTWCGILTGLALATIERNATDFVEQLLKQKLDRAFWSLAAMFVDPHIEVPDLPNQEHFRKIRNAVLEYRQSSRPDLRKDCLAILPSDRSFPSCSTIQDANELLTCFTPLAGCELLPIKIDFEFPTPDNASIEDISSLLSTARLINKEVATNLIEKLGGEGAILLSLSRQMPWLLPPRATLEGELRTVRTDWYLVSERFQLDPHGFTCKVCEILISLSPTSDFAASDAIDPALGTPITQGNYKPWSKKIPRDNLPPNARIEWNVAFNETVKTKANVNLLTTYAQRLAALIPKTKEILFEISEYWIGAKLTKPLDAIASDINAALAEANDLAYSEQEARTTTTHGPRSKDDRSGALVSSILGNLVPRLQKVSKDGSFKALASFAGQLSTDAKEMLESTIWRTVENPPLSDLQSLSTRLREICSVLQEMGYDHSERSIRKILKVSKKGGKGKRLAMAGRHCYSSANLRLKRRIDIIERDIRKQGCKAKCIAKPLNDKTSCYWPNVELAILVEISKIEEHGDNLMKCIQFASDRLKQDWPFVVAPIINSKVASALAMRNSTHFGPFPDIDFESQWSSILKIPIASRELLNAFDDTINSCIEFSSLIQCRNLEKLHKDEEKVVNQIVKSFENGMERLELANGTDDEPFLAEPIQLVIDSWSIVKREFELKNKNEKIFQSLCLDAKTPDSKWSQRHLISRTMIILLGCGLANLWLEEN